MAFRLLARVEIHVRPAILALSYNVLKREVVQSFCGSSYELCSKRGKRRIKRADDEKSIAEVLAQPRYSSIESRGKSTTERKA